MAIYEAVVGLEVHAELSTRTKIFCACPTASDAPPNTQCCPVCMGLPGALPVLNRRVVELAVMAGLAAGCEIAKLSRQDRKNYFYPDLPKAYQISQYELPLCVGGAIDIGEKRVGITRIHIEEDAGKLTHAPGGDTLIDLNRAGVPLIEVVSEPDIRSADEALQYLTKLRALLVAAGVSDCRMERGAMRVDVNLSVRPAGDDRLGTRTEIKNLNSLASVRRAIEGEFRRQIALLESGGEVLQETRRFDPATGATSAMRSKENADDYRYFPDPDLPPIALSDEWIERIRANLPELPDAKKARLAKRYDLSPREAELLAGAPGFSSAFEAAWNATDAREELKALALSFLARADGDFPDADPSALSSLAEMLRRGELNTGSALRALATGAVPSETAQLSDRAELSEIARRAVLENPELARSFRSGRRNAMKGLMGAVMRATRGRANPRLAEALLREALEA